MTETMQVFTFFCQGVGSKTQVHNFCKKKKTPHLKYKDILVKSKGMDYPKIMLILI